VQIVQVVARAFGRHVRQGVVQNELDALGRSGCSGLGSDGQQNREPSDG
jgi:hypothetical protein